MSKSRNVVHTAMIVACIALMIVDACKIVSWGYPIGGTIFGLMFVIGGAFVIREIWRS